MVVPEGVTRPRIRLMATTIASIAQSIMSASATIIRRAPGRPSAAAAAILMMAIAAPLQGDRQALAGEVPVKHAWIVKELTGAGFSRPSDAQEGQWQALHAGVPIEPGRVVRTDGSGRMELTNGIDTIRLSPSSEIELPVAQDDGPLTRVVQWVGSVFFHVGKRPGPQFEVDTPYIVAIVKGTQFTTTVSDAGAGIKVSEGIVGVSAVSGGGSIDVSAGESASISAGGALSPGGSSSDSPAFDEDSGGGANHGGGDGGGNDDSHGHGCHGEGGCHRDDHGQGHGGHT